MPEAGQLLAAPAQAARGTWHARCAAHLPSATALAPPHARAQGLTLLVCLDEAAATPKLLKNLVAHAGEAGAWGTASTLHDKLAARTSCTLASAGCTPQARKWLWRTGLK